MKWELLTSSEITLPKKHKDDQKMRGRSLRIVPMAAKPLNLLGGGGRAKVFRG